jgi:hypothetical protein
VCGRGEGDCKKKRKKKKKKNIIKKGTNYLEKGNKFFLLREKRTKMSTRKDPSEFYEQSIQGSIFTVPKRYTNIQALGF